MYHCIQWRIYGKRGIKGINSPPPIGFIYYATFLGFLAKKPLALRAGLLDKIISLP